jgi:hypothetical protein
MTDPDETASLIGSLIDGYREHVAAERVPGQVRGQDVEDQADMLAAAAARLADLLTAFAQEPQRSIDAIAVFRRLSETAASMESAAAELRCQGMVRPRGRCGARGCCRVERRPGRPEVRGRHLRVGR